MRFTSFWLLVACLLAALGATNAAVHPLQFARAIQKRQEPTTPQNQSQTLGQVLAADGNYSIFNELVSNTTFFSFLNETQGNYTVFAPRNEAFERLPAQFLGALNSTFGGPLVVGLLSFHIVNGSVLNSTDVPLGTTELATLLGLPINVTNTGAAVSITGSDPTQVLAVVVDPDRNATNGVIHGINAVLDPLRALRSATGAPTAPTGGTVATVITGTPTTGTVGPTVIGTSVPTAGTVITSTAGTIITEPTAGTIIIGGTTTLGPSATPIATITAA
ncbi:FAS1 domain-containing protein [Hyaloraphidium curvatum]|nr:FAS1 domain-containing protein [Hyaloraphidium curvatum]